MVSASATAQTAGCPALKRQVRIRPAFATLVAGPPFLGVAADSRTGRQLVARDVAAAEFLVLAGQRVKLLLPLGSGTVFGHLVVQRFELAVPSLNDIFIRVVEEH